MLIDHFFKLAVPIIVLSMIVSRLAVWRNNRKPFYEGEEGEARRDAINKRYRTTLKSIIICILFVGVWLLLVATLVDVWGYTALTYIVGGFLLLPVGTVCAAVIALYMAAVHGAAKH